jgi:hypothetical protein
MAQKQDLVDRLRQAKYADVAEAQGFPVRRGHARFTDERTLDVDGEELVAGGYVVATGAQPYIPDLPGMDSVDWLTSTTAMEQTTPADVDGRDGRWVRRAGAGPALGAPRRAGHPRRPVRTARRAGGRRRCCVASSPTTASTSSSSSSSSRSG